MGFSHFEKIRKNPKVFLAISEKSAILLLTSKHHVSLGGNFYGIRSKPSAGIQQAHCGLAGPAGHIATGDSTPIALYAVLCVMAIALAGIAAVTRKKNA